MALVVAERVQDTTTTTGTGTVTLSGTAPTGFQNFSVIGNGNTTFYTIALGAEWEVGIGTYTSAGTTLARTTVLASSNSNAAVNFSAGTKAVWVDYPAARSVNSIGTPGGVPYYSSASVVSSSAALAANAIVIGGGAGVAPSTTTTASGVLTFLATPSSANLAALLTDETGTGAAVFAGSPTFTGTVGCAAITPTSLVDISGASAGQIKFPATQNPSADAHTLDDYEEGTWTAVLSFGGDSTGITFSRLNCYYTKVGDTVMLSLDMILSSIGSAVNDYSLVSGLPFDIGSGGNGVFTAPVFGASTASPKTVIAYGNSHPYIFLDNAADSSNIVKNDFTNASYVLFTGSYRV